MALKNCRQPVQLDAMIIDECQVPRVAERVSSSDPLGGKLDDNERLLAKSIILGRSNASARDAVAGLVTVVTLAVAFASNAKLLETPLFGDAFELRWLVIALLVIILSAFFHSFCTAAVNAAASEILKKRASAMKSLNPEDD